MVSVLRGGSVGQGLEVAGEVRRGRRNKRTIPAAGREERVGVVEGTEQGLELLLGAVEIDVGDGVAAVISEEGGPLATKSQFRLRPFVRCWRTSVCVCVCVCVCPVQWVVC